LENGRIAIPSNGNCGLNGVRSKHFGHCDVFTLIDIENGIIKDESILNNEEHGHGGCIVPVNLLAKNDVNAIIVAGIGRRPLAGFQNAGIDVYSDKVYLNINKVVYKLIEDKLQMMSVDEACNGGGNCHEK